MPLRFSKSRTFTVFNSFHISYFGGKVVMSYRFLGCLVCLFFGSIASFGQPSAPVSLPEYAPTRGVWVEWDFNPYTWSLYSDLIEEIQTETKVYLVVINQTEEDDMINRLSNDGVPLDSLVFVQTPAYRMWIRDHGPFSIIDGNSLAFVDLNDLANSGVDEDLPVRLADELGIESYVLPYTLCGGNFMVDSEGTLFCTSRLFTNNPQYDNNQILADLATYLGIQQVHTFQSQANDYWGHIDMQMKLLNDTTLVLSSVSSGANYDSLEANYTQLMGLTAPNGVPYTIERLPHADDWKTYANSLIVNGKVIVPIYDHPNDSLALSIYADLMPDHEVVGVDCNKIIGWEGALHCITMQMPNIPSTPISMTREHPMDSEIRVFPNPVQIGGELVVEIRAKAGPVMIQWVDTKGRSSSLPFTLSGGQARYSIPVMPRVPGAYLLRITAEGITSFHRVVVHE
jgi:agmatine deiminase